MRILNTRFALQLILDDGLEVALIPITSKTYFPIGTNKHNGSQPSSTDQRVSVMRLSPGPEIVPFRQASEPRTASPHPRAFLIRESHGFTLCVVAVIAGFPCRFGLHIRFLPANLPMVLDDVIGRRYVPGSIHAVDVSGCCALEYSTDTCERGFRAAAVFAVCFSVSFGCARRRTPSTRS